MITDKVVTIQTCERSKTILSKVSDNQDFIVTCNYAIILLTDELIENIAKLKETFKSLCNAGITMCELSAEYNQVAYLNEYAGGVFDGEPLLTDEVIEAIDDTNIDEEGIIFVEDKILDTNSFLLPELRIGGSRVHIDDYGFWFTAYIKSTDILLTTETIPFEKINV